MSDSKAAGSARSPESRVARRKRVRASWWAAPVSAALICVLVVIGLNVGGRLGDYRAFLHKRAVVDRQTFYPGLTIDGVDVSDMDFQAAQAHFEAMDQQHRSAYFVVLMFGTQRWTLEEDAFGYRSDHQKILESAWAVGRYGSFEERFTAASRAAGEWSRNYTITRTIDQNRLLNELTPIAAALTQPGANAQVTGFSTTKLTFSFKEGTVGYVVDAPVLMREVLDKVAQGGGELPILRQEIAPPLTAEQLSKLFGKVSSATTNASFSDSNRLTNIKLACKTVTGTAVQPGETFSFNKVLGERTTKKGYKPAGALENGMHTKQVGGGICQVSTTLFNAVAKADLQIVDRQPHSIPSVYVDLGKDAAVNWPNQDFKFKNNGLYPVYIVATLGKDKKVTFSIYGKKLDDGVTIKVVSKKTGTTSPGRDTFITDASLLPGEQVVVEEARNGYTSETYRVYYNANGAEIDRKRLFRSTYRAAGAVIRVGG